MKKMKGFLIFLLVLLLAVALFFAGLFIKVGKREGTLIDGKGIEAGIYEGLSQVIDDELEKFNEDMQNGIVG